MSGIFGLLYNLLENFFASINHIIVFLSNAFIKTVTIPLSVIYASNIVIYCLRIIAKMLLTSIIKVLVILGIFTLSIFISVFVAVYEVTFDVPILGPILAPILSSATAIGIASIFLVTYIIIAVIYGEIAHALSIGLKISYEEAPNPPKLRPPF